MSSLFSFKLWLIFLQRMINTLYPANIIFLIFLVPVRKKIKLTRPIIFLLLLLSVDLLLRIVSFFSGIPFAHRYFLPSMIILTVFTGFGMLAFIQFISRHLVKKFPKLTEKHITVAIFLIILFSYSGKALHFSNDKKWLKAISSLIQTNIQPGGKAILLSNYEENRFTYYSGCEEMLLFSQEKDFQIRRRVRNGNDNRWNIESKGIKAFNHYIKTASSQLFIIYRIKKQNLTPTTENLFPTMKLIGQFKDRRKKYRYFVFQKKEVSVK